VFGQPAQHCRTVEPGQGRGRFGHVDTVLVGSLQTMVKSHTSPGASIEGARHVGSRDAEL
jgi:hypothetical protein